MVFVVFKIVRSFLSTTPFCRGVLGTANGLRMPFSSYNCLNLFDVNSPPRFVLTTLIVRLLSFSTRTLNFLKISNTFDFSFKINYTHVFLEKSSINRRKCLLLPWNSSLITPHTSAWMSSSGLLALVIDCLGKLLRWCFRVGTLLILGSTCVCMVIKSHTIFFFDKSSRTPKLRWPNHSQERSS